MARLDVCVADVPGFGKLWYLAPLHPLPGLSRGELRADQGDRDIEPPLVAEMYDPLRHTSGNRDRGGLDRASLLLVKVGGVWAVERPPPREGHDTTGQLEEAGVRVAVAGREAPDHRDPRHLARPCVGSHPSECAGGRMTYDQHAAGGGVDRRQHRRMLIGKRRFGRRCSLTRQRDRHGLMAQGPQRWNDRIPRRPIEPESTDEDDVHRDTCSFLRAYSATVRTVRP